METFARDMWQAVPLLCRRNLFHTWSMQHSMTDLFQIHRLMGMKKSVMARKKTSGGHSSLKMVTWHVMVMKQVVSCWELLGMRLKTQWQVP